MGERIFKAAIRFLTMKGYDIIDEDVEGFIVILDEHVDASEEHPDIAFVKMYDALKMEDPCLKTSEFEAVAIPWLADSDYADVALRYDTLGFFIIGGDRAMIKHHINAEIIKR